MPEIGDVVEMIVDKPERNLSAGIQGTLVHAHNNNAYEIDLTNQEGETRDVFALNSDEFVVVWRAETQEWIPIAEQTVAVIKHLPDKIAKEVLDFACFLSLKHHLRPQIAG